MKKLSLNTICNLAILLALEVVLNRFLSIQTPFLKIGFSFVPVVMAGMLYGPLGGAIVCGFGDMIGALLFPFGPYHPGFSICGALMGAMYGWFMYLESSRFDNRERLRVWPNVIVPVMFNCLVVGLVLNTLWVSQLYGSRTYWGWFVYRVPDEIGMSVVKIAVSPLLAPVARKLCDLGIVNPRK